MLMVWMPYQREQRIAKAIESHGGHVEFDYFGPDWIPQSVLDRMPWFDGISLVCQLEPSAELLPAFGSLTRINVLLLDKAQVTDVSLEHLKGLTSLRDLYIEDTQVTAKGRAMLRKSLPNCHIKPNP